MKHKPGVHIEEITNFPPSISQVETAIPVFIGYTEVARDQRKLTLRFKPKRITSLEEYERYFGFPKAETQLVVTIIETPGQPVKLLSEIDPALRSKYWMHYALQMYFANGGGPCWIVSVGNYRSPGIEFAKLKRGLIASRRIDEITLILFPDAQNLPTADDYYDLYGEAMDVCNEIKDRFTIMDVWNEEKPPSQNWSKNIQTLRDKTPNRADTLKYGAAYFPDVETSLHYWYVKEEAGERKVKVIHQGGDNSYNGNLAELKRKNNALYQQAKTKLRETPLILPPSPAIAGIYAGVDASRGVWKAPANVNMNLVTKPVISISNSEQEDLNIDVIGGKSINAIRSFPGRGPAIVWGSRTLAGNSNDWRYVPVRRFFNMVEESVMKGTEHFVFEPNDANTWARVKSMIENFLLLQWRAGALMGATPKDAFFVKVGLNETMTPQDILEGRMIVEIGMAPIHPAEFIIFLFSQKMAETK